MFDPDFFKQSIVSPLRYPGAKRQLVPVIEGIIKANVPPPRLLVEPFCGGATTSLRLAGTDHVDHVVLADADPLLAAFWHTAAFDSKWLINAMWNEPVTVERWDWWRLAEPKGRRETALKCLFLNRTTFSGILHGRAGPLGGRSQKSEYKIDCRFGKKGLERRISAVADLATSGRILDVWNLDWRSTVERAKKRFDMLTPDEMLIYLDPPYVEKAPFLYEWSFESTEHKNLAQAINGTSEFQWLLSYDDNDLARSLYTDYIGQSRLLVNNRYTAAGSERRKTREELLVTNYPTIPTSDRYRLLGTS
ncbi:DNA adenine methylase [Streptosporangium sp. NPDC023963]|uniref:DNA adenine methylase n=1 Tax=Streptosporangium sp. NPDC023963 TaxID=3155608 RepID=UPI003424897E